MTNPPAIDLDIEYYVDSVYDDSQRIRLAASWIAQHYGFDRFQASISIVGDDEIREVNRTELKHDWATDVISFVIEMGDKVVDGEVIASVDTAARLHQAAGWSVEDELLLYVVHGLLHVAGLDDLDESQRREMRAAEQACLLALGVAHAAELLDRWDNISY